MAEENSDDLIWSPEQKKQVDFLIRNQELCLTIVQQHRKVISELTNQNATLINKLKELQQEVEGFTIPSLN